MINRDFIAQVVIIVAACAGGWMMFVGPVLEEIGELSRQIEASPDSAAGLDDAAIAQGAMRIAALRGRLREIDRRNEVSRNTVELHRQIVELASSHDVDVQRVTPARARDRAAEDEGVVVNRVQVTVQGGYTDVAAFLEEVHRLPGFLRPHSLHLTPDDGDGLGRVTVRFDCEALFFRVDEALAALGRSSDAQE